MLLLFDGLSAPAVVLAFALLQGLHTVCVLAAVGVNYTVVVPVLPILAPLLLLLVALVFSHISPLVFRKENTTRSPQ